MSDRIKQAEEVWKGIMDALRERKDLSAEEFKEAAYCIQIQRMPEDLKRKIELRQVLANYRNELGCFADSDDDLFRFDIEKIDQEVGRYYIKEMLEG